MIYILLYTYMPILGRNSGVCVNIYVMIYHSINCIIIKMLIIYNKFNERN